MTMRPLGQYSFIAGHDQHGLNGDRWEDMLGGYQRTGTAWPEPPGCPERGQLWYRTAAEKEQKKRPDVVKPVTPWRQLRRGRGGGRLEV